MKTSTDFEILYAAAEVGFLSTQTAIIWFTAASSIIFAYIVAVYYVLRHTSLFVRAITYILFCYVYGILLFIAQEYSGTVEFLSEIEQMRNAGTGADKDVILKLERSASFRHLILDMWMWSMVPMALIMFYLTFLYRWRIRPTTPSDSS